MKRTHHWSEAEIKYLRDNWDTMGTEAIADHLGRSYASVKAKSYDLSMRRKRGARSAPPRRHHLVRSNPAYVITSGTAVRAADHVRIHDGTPVYRCNADGAPNPTGDCWKYGYGSLVLTDEEMIAKAERKGWDADAWRALA